MKSKTIAVDLEKNVFEIGISDRPADDEDIPFKPGKVLVVFCESGAGDGRDGSLQCRPSLGREIQNLGHAVVLISPQYVRPYVPRSKTDRADVKGLLEAHRNADIRAVPIKTVAQQQLTALHRIRSTWMRTRTARINMVRGCWRVRACAADGSPAAGARSHGLIEDADVEIPMTVRVMFSEVCTEIRELEARIQSVERELEALARQMPEVARLRSIPGIGLLTSTAMVGFVGDPRRFRSCRHFASYMGLTPRERSSGNRRRLGAISKQGNVYLRMLLIHGGRTLLWGAHRKGAQPSALQKWGLRLHTLRGHNTATVALANKLASLR